MGVSTVVQPKKTENSKAACERCAQKDEVIKKLEKELESYKNVANSEKLSLPEQDCLSL